MDRDTDQVNPPNQLTLEGNCTQTIVLKICNTDMIGKHHDKEK